MKPLRNIISRICTSLLLCIYGFSLFPTTAFHHHPSHCDKDNRRIENDICHQTLYHAIQQSACHHPSHIVPIVEVCKLCKLYFASPSAIAPFLWQNFCPVFADANYAICSFDSFDFLASLTNKGPPFLAYS